jgi:hypothetical protein
VLLARLKVAASAAAILAMGGLALAGAAAGAAGEEAVPAAPPRLAQSDADAASALPGYVYERDGQFWLNGEPIRFWGVNLGWGGAWKQGGDSHKELSHADLDAYVGRLKALGFNAVRIFPPSSFMFGDLKTGQDSGYAKNDGSLIEKFDYFLYRLKEEGLRVYMSLNMFGPRSREIDALFQGSPAELAAWKAANADYGWPQTIDQAFLVDRSWREIKIRNALRVLNHFNKWTGKHYYEDEVFALYELNNEVRFAERILAGELEKPVTGRKRGGMPAYFKRQYQAAWNEYLRERYGATAGLPDGYLRPGESLADGSIKLAPSFRQSGYTKERARDFARFVLEHYIGTYRELVAAIRATAPPGVGANVVPINVDSISGDGDSIISAFAVARGGFNSGNGYEMHHYTTLKTGQDPDYPYVSMLALPPAPYGRDPAEYHHKRMNTEIGRIQGQPFVMYEGMSMTPNIFKAEYPIIQAVFGSWQDHGGYFFYQYPIKGFAKDPTWHRGPLLYSKNDQWDSTPGFARDEVMLSAAWAAGAAFRHFGIPPAPNPTVFRFGAEALFDLQWRDEATANEAWRQIARTAYQYGAELAFAPDGPFVERVEGPVREGDFTEPLAVADGAIRWDWPHGRLIVDTPRVKIYAGRFPEDRQFEFTDGVRIGDLDRPWGYFILASDTDEPIASSERVFLSLVQTSDNSGFAIDPSRLDRDVRSVTGWRRAIMSEGGLPVVVERMSGEVTLPPLPGRVLIKRDFDLKQIGGAEDATRRIRISAAEPVFQWILLSGSAAAQP